jgi:hypothetical protein
MQSYKQVRVIGHRVDFQQFAPLHSADFCRPRSGAFGNESPDFPLARASGQKTVTPSGFVQIRAIRALGSWPSMRRGEQTSPLSRHQSAGRGSRRTERTRSFGPQTRDG